MATARNRLPLSIFTISTPAIHIADRDAKIIRAIVRGEWPSKSQAGPAPTAANSLLRVGAPTPQARNLL
jgi:hypothetical protein